MQGNISRRDLIKKSAVAGGVVWAAPTLLAQPASASHGSHCAVRCQSYCRVKLEPGSGGNYNPSQNCESSPTAGGFQCVTTIPGDAPATTCCPGTGTYTVTGNSATSVTITVTNPLCKLVAFRVKQGNLEGGCGEGTISANCDSGTYTGETSHIEFTICCQTS